MKKKKPDLVRNKPTFNNVFGVVAVVAESETFLLDFPVPGVLSALFKCTALPGVEAGVGFTGKIDLI